MEVTATDGEGNTIVCLERKSVQPFRSQDEYLYAMKEDLAEWFNTLYSTNVTVDDFLEYLETGVVLCQHANKVNEYIIEQLESGEQPRHWDKEALELAKQVIQYKSNVKPGSFQCRDNISNYISWCRWTLGIPDTLLFESDDLVMRKNERNVVLCVLEVARRGARFGMLAPCLVQLEQEIDAEIAGEEPPPPVKIMKPRRTIDMMSLDEMVREIAKECTCPDQFPIIRVSEGKYKVGESLTLIFVRILRNHVMVRIGGGWDTLENYLNRHDPCRCDASKNQHKTRRYSQTAAKRRSSMTSPAPQSYPDSAKPRKLPATPSTGMAHNSEAIGGHSPRSEPIRRNSCVTSREVDRLRNSDGGQRPSSATRGSGRPQSPSLSRRTQSPRVQDPSRRAQSPMTFKQPSAQSYQPVVKPEPVRPQPKRPGSAGPTAPQNIHTPRKTERSRDQANGNVNDDRGRSVSRSSSMNTRNARSHSVGAEEMRRNVTRTRRNSGTSADVILITRDKSGRHVVSKPGARTPSNGTVPITNGNGVGNTDRRPNSARMKISPDKLLPSKPKTIMRSQSTEAKCLSEQSESVSGSCNSVNSDITSDRPSCRRQSSVTSLGSVTDLDNIPVPVGDHKLNKEMEKLFEEYRAAEKGWFHYDDADEEVNMLSASASSTKSAPECSGTSRPSNTGRRTPTVQTGGSHVRIRPVTPNTALRAAAGGGTTTSSRDSAVGKSAAQARSGTPNAGRSSVRRSQTPNPTATPSQVHLPARCRTPLISSRTDDVKPRTDTGLRKRPTTPSTGSRTDGAVHRKPVTRSSSLSRVAINKQIGCHDDGLTLSTKRRSRSKDDILDDDGGEGRRSRSDTARKRDVVRSERRSASRDALQPTSDGLIRTLREPPRSLPATPSPMTVDIPVDVTTPVERPTTPYSARPRKDDLSKPKTRIPRPSSARSFRSPTPEAGSLKRFDSGVDINISPTENNSVQGDEDICHQWQPPEAMTLTGHSLGYAAVNDGSDDYY